MIISKSNIPCVDAEGIVYRFCLWSTGEKIVDDFSIALFTEEPAAIPVGNGKFHILPFTPQGMRPYETDENIIPVWFEPYEGGYDAVCFYKVGNEYRIKQINTSELERYFDPEPVDPVDDPVDDPAVFPAADPAADQFDLFVASSG